MRKKAPAALHGGGSLVLSLALLPFHEGEVAPHLRIGMFSELIDSCLHFNKECTGTLELCSIWGEGQREFKLIFFPVNAIGLKVNNRES